jgi:predicted permease
VIRPGIRRAFSLGAWRRDLREEEVDEEIRLHLELRAEQLARRGMPPAQARAEAARRFGQPHQARAELLRAATRREARMRLRDWWDGLRQDVRHAVRGLRREPAFVAFVVATLALGIGANAAMFGVIDRLLLRGPEHVRDPGRVVRIYTTVRYDGIGELTSGTSGYVTLAHLRDHAHAFEGFAGYSARDATLGRGQGSRRVRVTNATASLFPLLGVKAQVGRFFGEDEDRASGGEHVAVLGDAVWRGAYGADPRVVGTQVMLDGEPYTVVGVAPPGFTGVNLERMDAWVPLSLSSARVMPDWATTWFAQWMHVVGRLRPGVTREQAGADATAAFRRSYDGKNKEEAAGSVSAGPLTFGDDAKEGMEVVVSRWLLGMSLVVLLVACSNVGNLLLARAMRREREAAVRVALGIGRARLVRLLLLESTLLALAGCAAGLVVAHAGGQLVRRTLLGDVEWTTPPVNGRVAALSVALALLVGLGVGLVPALRASGANVVGSLKAGSPEGGARRSRLRTTLAAAQVALSVVLLIGAGLFVRSLGRVNATPMGFEPARVLAASMEWVRQPPPSAHQASDPAQGAAADSARKLERRRRDRAYDDALDAVRRLPGVAGASVSIGTPFYSSFGVDLKVPGMDSIPSLEGGGPYVAAVSPDFFRTIGTRVVRGRGFTAADGANGERVAVVSATMARLLWPGRDPLGNCLLVDGAPCSRVVGVVEDAHRYELKEKPAMQYYLPLGQEKGIGGRMLLVRLADASPAGVLAATERVRRELERRNPDLVYVEVKTLQQSLDPQVRPWKLGATMFTAFGALALLVAAIGLFSVTAYGVIQRRRELGVRVALGAQSGDILRLVLGEGVRTALAGTLLGAAVALAGARLVTPLLFDTSPRDPAVYATVAAALLLAAVLATLAPSWRASRTDPALALRAD